jgi:cell fate (sporulation/competence/biofilm development) regulator YlbF (YheA/YmcA/DUF963 family)
VIKYYYKKVGGVKAHMIATIDSIQLIDEATVIGKMISDSEIAEEYRLCKYKLETDIDVKALIKKFSVMKERYEEVQRFGKYHPDYDTVSKDVRVLKRELDLNEVVANFKKAETNLEGLLIEISQTIAGAVSTNIKVPTGNPFFDNTSCGGGCGSGGACSCG